MAVNESLITELNQQLAALRVSVDMLTLEIQKRARATASSAGPTIASDADLDGQYGNPIVKTDPKKWRDAGKENMKGRRFSECPPDYLDEVASFLDWSAGKADEKNETTAKGKPISGFKRADAARARGWAKRIREGKVAPPPLVPVEERSGTSGWVPVDDDDDDRAPDL